MASEVLEKARSLGLTDEEVSEILHLLGREPSETELAMYSVMWSEHCSYKSSKSHLKRLPQEGKKVVAGPGENAGVIDLGGGLYLAMRIESHNHPCAVEPFQGAATGVGGIIRDVLSSGARPLALLDGLFVGPPQDLEKNLSLDRIVAGISFYGNCVGVPNAGGLTVFDEAFSSNPLVNVMCIGLMRPEHMMRARVRQKGLFVLLGAPTGRDGIGGVSILASSAFEEGEGCSKLPSVQIADPYEEKRLIEACLEIFRSHLALGVQDLGGGGLTCAASEVASRSGAGAVLDLSAVPLREREMAPWEIAISESQERMLLVVEERKLKEVLSICERHEVSAAVVGELVEDSSGTLRAYFQGKEVAAVPAASLAGGVPEPARPLKEAEQRWEEKIKDLDKDAIKDREPFDEEEIYSQYDHQLFLNTCFGPGDGACVLLARLPEEREAVGYLAVTMSAAPRLCEADPKLGSFYVVLHAAAEIAAKGADPAAVVDCLNFGSPEDPEVMWQFSQAVDGITEACNLLGVPVVGGNVSFYNKTGDHNIPPTPVIGMVGTAPSFPKSQALGEEVNLWLLCAEGGFEPYLGGCLLNKEASRKEPIFYHEAKNAAHYLQALRRLFLTGKAYVRPVFRGGLIHALKRAERALSRKLSRPELSARDLMCESPLRALVVAEAGFELEKHLSGLKVRASLLNPW